MMKRRGIASFSVFALTLRLAAQRTSDIEVSLSAGPLPTSPSIRIRLTGMDLHAVEYDRYEMAVPHGLGGEPDT